MATTDQVVYVLDFGAQYGQLIARRVRDLHVYSEIVPCDISAAELADMRPAALILSGGPASVYAEDAPKVDPAIFELGVPILGFCYGHQITAVTLGGTVGHSEVGEYGHADLHRKGASQLFDGTPEEQSVWMSHRDAVSVVPEGFTVTASTDVCPVAAMECASKRIYTTQFHPEVRHTPHGKELLSNFLFNIAGLEPTWTMDNIVEQKVAEIREQVGDARVILGLSGGVDSSVVAALCARAIGKQLTCVFVNHGLLRKGEPEQVEEVFTKQFDVDFVHVHAEERYLKLLEGVSDPEQKRHIIGAEFIDVFAEEAAKLSGIDFLAQGTIYPDVIESGSVKGSAVIKSHHNVGGLPADVKAKFTGGLVEPIRMLFKDEVRKVGEELGMPRDMVWRQPFPGPGLAIRIMGEITEDKLETVRESDAILREEVAAAGLDRDINQYFTVLTNTRTVGVMGDERTHDFVLAIRAVTTDDFMTVDWARLPYDLLAKVSARIVNEVPRVNRIVYDITTKPPATVEWE